MSVFRNASNFEWVKRICFVLVLGYIYFVWSTANAFGFETTRASGLELIDRPGEITTSLKTSPSPAAADPCLPLLKVRQDSPVSASASNQRSAGQAAALGLVFGVRIALGPKEVTGSRRIDVGPQLWQSREDGGSYALAVADYRACKNEQALKNLDTDFRWQR